MVSTDVTPSLVEYKSVVPQRSATAAPAGTTGPAISFADFSSSSTDYSRLAKAGPV